MGLSTVGVGELKHLCRTHSTGFAWDGRLKHILDLRGDSGIRFCQKLKRIALVECGLSGETVLNGSLLVSIFFKKLIVMGSVAIYTSLFFSSATPQWLR